ncbi:MAG: hypothetical protein QS98_C0011G0033 [archaeon GW2011_AR3]|nr:MAG: hypothetical protein QS98_C0011G0033 [archaeon GW2011_AR3]MBS3109705.1 hypothetical protein [Candidatus Woesearchaeota archaeon]
MAIELISVLWAGIAKLFTTLFTGVYDFFMSVMPKAFAFLFEFIKRSVGWFAGEYVAFKAKLKFWKLKKSK